GAKAAQKRERNADKNAAKGSKSQSKSNAAATNILCTTCRQAFVTIYRLEEHAQNKHSKTIAECFPTFGK
ncbi:At2g23090 like protein, partial [Desarmillaria tabescens]